MSSASNLKNTQDSTVWLITGCSSGLGLGLAHHILTTPPSPTSRPHNVIATARSLSALTAAFPSPPPSNLLLLPLDVTSKSETASVFAHAIAAFGHVNIVVNNAGYGLLGDAEGAAEEEARGVMETNFWGSVGVGLRGVECMREYGGGKGGVVVQVSSYAGRVGFAGCAFYAARFAVSLSFSCSLYSQP
jgi:NADP-dependent 3-hydroxy acid dehydrogenase YdfG